MSKKNILLAITNGIWLIDMHSAEQLGQNVAAVLAGEKFWNVDHKSKPEFTVIEKGTDAYFSSSLNTAKPGSVAVINISGPIMKEDNCGDPGTKTYESLIQQASLNPNITGIVLVIDSPGGTVSGTQSLSNTIKQVSKPIVTLAEDLMASAAYWIGSSTNYVMANTGTSRIGSIGTMLSFADMQPYWEKQGVKFHEIYATKSTEKNSDFAEARKGNYSKLINNTLDPLNNEFLNAVTTNRGEKLNREKTLNGQVYVAADALKYGLIDGIGNLNDAVNKVNELAGIKAEESTEKNQTQNNHMKKITLLASHAALLALCGASIEAGKESVDVELNDELIGKINSELAEKSNAVETANAAKTELEEAKKKLAASEETIAANKTEIENLKAQVEKLGGASAGSTITAKKGTDVIETNPEAKYETSYDREKKAQKI